jgi:NADH:ubiquinone oxidoreductase subunit 4 (subunit M)
MTRRTVDTSIHRAANVAGLAYLLIIVTSVLASLVVLHLLSGGGHSTVLETERSQALVELLLSARAAGLTTLTVFLCLGTVLFCYLLFKSRHVPRPLAAWGMFSRLTQSCEPCPMSRF